MKKKELNGYEWLEKDFEEFKEKEGNGVYDLVCGCKILVQEQSVFTLKICDFHASEKSNKPFMNMARVKTGKGTWIK